MQRILSFTNIKSHTNYTSLMHSHGYSTKSVKIYRKCFVALGVPETASQDTVREAYIKLVKVYHPDSGHADADKDTFFEIDTAFRILQKKFAKNRRGIDDDQHEITEKDFDIRHTAPQHRQYLNFDGVGVGTPFQRERQYHQVKAIRAQQRVMEHRMEKAQAEENALITKKGYYKKHAIKTKYGIDRVVEDLIQESMSKGEFTNLAGSGKPLPSHQQQNPYVDFITHKMNKILLDNGFTPEWITLQKEIRTEVEDLKLKLANDRKFLGSIPLSNSDLAKWKTIYDKHEKHASLINKKIDKFNLIVPIIEKQFFRIKYEKIANHILDTGEYGLEQANYCGDGVGSNQSNKRVNANSDSLLSLVSSLFMKS